MRRTPVFALAVALALALALLSVIPLSEVEWGICLSLCPCPRSSLLTTPWLPPKPPPPRYTYPSGFTLRRQPPLNRPTLPLAALLLLLASFAHAQSPTPPPAPATD